MLDSEFLEHVADFYGSFSLDEMAERFAVSTVELVDYLEDLIDANLVDIRIEMGYTDEEEAEDDED